MKKLDVDKRREAVFKHWQESGNMAETGRAFGITREYVRQIVNAKQQ